MVAIKPIKLNSANMLNFEFTTYQFALWKGKRKIRNSNPKGAKILLAYGGGSIFKTESRASNC
jgi:alcohol dehydrogenase YqhD (iron-dependent ADH family)